MEYITINILDKEYQISCSLEFKEPLIQAATYLSHKMLEVRNKGKINTFEGILITAAINIAYEALQAEHQNINDAQSLIDKLNNALSQDYITSNKLKFEYNNTDC